MIGRSAILVSRAPGERRGRDDRAAKLKGRKELSTRVKKGPRTTKKARDVAARVRLDEVEVEVCLGVTGQR